MPGGEAAYPELGDDLYPKTEDEHRRLLRDVLEAFEAADQARSQYVDRWQRYYKLRRSWLKRKKNDWRSKVFIPVAFWNIETVLPRLVAQLPKAIVKGVEESDVPGAEAMEDLLDWAENRSGLFLELVKATKSALTYGTGILKTYHRQVKKRFIRPAGYASPQQAPAPMVDPETGGPMVDVDGEPLVASPNGQQASGEPDTYEVYDGPAAEYVDIENFWPAPEATGMDDTRHAFERQFRDMSHIAEFVKKGVYRMPENMGPSDFTSEEEPAQLRAASVELGSMAKDPTHKPVELLHMWTEERIITVANRKAILRVQTNPFQHGEIPYVRIVDYLVEGEFWGMGEIEPIEGLQDVMNALVNQRIDNVKLSMDKMFMVMKNAVADLRDLRTRPGGIIEVDTSNTGTLEQAIMPLDFGDVTSSAFVEVEQIERFIEKVSGITGYQQGTDAPSLNDTATGIALIQEAGNTRQGFKTVLAEMTGLTRLARQFGSIIQQFWDTERMVRLVGPKGEDVFKTFTPESIQGAFDYDIEAQSVVQTESLRQASADSLFQMLFPVLPPDLMTGGLGPGQQKLVEEVLRSRGKKDIDAYLAPPPQPTLPGQGQFAMGPEQIPAGLEQQLLPQEQVPA
jgi:hypothetical protein